LKIGIISSAPALRARVFLDRHLTTLAAQGIEIGAVMIDDNAAKHENPLKHSLVVARRQGRVGGCSTAVAFFRLVGWKLVTRARDPVESAPAPLPDQVNTIHVATVNSRPATEALRASGCDLVCLMGARVLTGETLRALAVPVINIHSSDPRFVRGGPVVVWEVLANHPAITLTIHEVVEALDAGAILAQAPQPILYRGGLGATIAQTMRATQPLGADLFLETVRRFRDGTLQSSPYTPGPLQVMPRARQTVQADWLCRRRTRSHVTGVPTHEPV
jgi:hypothetical protein